MSCGRCSKCGSNLYYRIVESDQYVLSAGVLNDPSELILKSQIFIDDKPAFYTFANQTKNMTGAEVFAMFAPPDEKDD